MNPYGDHLPIFPLLRHEVHGGDTARVERIEITVQRLVDRADKAYMAGRATTDEYDAWYSALNLWADKQYDALGT